jgi:hypothetical protein
MLTMAIRAGAAVNSGPKAKDPADEEMRRTLQFFEAERMNQKKLEVGRERYDLSQANRAKVIEGMTAELATRQKTVVIQPVASRDVSKEGSDSWSGLLLGVVALGGGFLAFRHYRSRQYA